MVLKPNMSDPLGFNTFPFPAGRRQATFHTPPQASAAESGASSSSLKIVDAGHGYAFPVRSGERFKIIDLHGEQIVDFCCWRQLSSSSSSRDVTMGGFDNSSNSSSSSNPNSSAVKIDKNRKVMMAYTRYKLRGATPAVGECLWTNEEAPLIKLIADTVKVHDMTFMCCNPGFYASQGHANHRSCATNIAEATRRYGLESWLEVPDPFNIFQNTPNYSMKGGLAPSKKGDYVEFEAMGDCVVAVSSCPYDLSGYSKPTDVGIEFTRKMD